MKSGSNLAFSGDSQRPCSRQPSSHAGRQAPSYLASHLAFFQKCVQNRGKTGALKRFVPSRIFLHFARNTADRREKSGTNRPVLTAAGTNLPMARGTRNALGLERGAWVRLPPSPPENEFCYSKMQARFFFLYLLKLETCFWKVRGKGGVFPNEKRKAKHFDSL